MSSRGRAGQSSTSVPEGSSSRSRRTETATASSSSTRPSQVPRVDLSLSQAEDVDWDEVGYDDDEDAHQSAAHRRMLQREMRGLIKQTTTDQAHFYEPDASDVVYTVLDESNALLKQTRQTTEATIDATLVLRVSELAFKRTTNFLADRQDRTGIDLEDFAARCQDYMQFGRGIRNMHARELSMSQRKRRRNEALAQGDDSTRRAIREARKRTQEARTKAKAKARAAVARAAEATGTEAVGYEMSDDSESSGDEGAGDDEEGGVVRRRVWEPLDWEHFGRFACLPRTRRAALARFLPRMPPLNDDKARVQRKRTAALRLEDLREVRPEVLRADELAATKKNENILTTLATDILQQLRRAVARGSELVRRIHESGLADGEDDDERDETVRQLLGKIGIHSNGGVDLIRFAVNPLSFSQTVENLFYISFLVRDGRAGLTYDHTGLPSIFPTEAEDGGSERVQEINGSSQRDNGRQRRRAVEDEGNDEPEDTQRHQMILSIDMSMWKQMIELFQIETPMIEHRETAQPIHPSGRAWFT
ncbi:hypothetical protein SEUCBS139899_006547 [Sporothrix eucalyptigena]|uniref:Non-structural maintenance of chromosomes element 4 n=1 Tax=Sporothrix eucalyptigena TaxID=1812306 RepID=A0ABP0B835_9PEZI